MRLGVENASTNVTLFDACRSNIFVFGFFETLKSISNSLIGDAAECHPLDLPAHRRSIRGTRDPRRRLLELVIVVVVVVVVVEQEHPRR